MRNETALMEPQQRHGKGRDAREKLLQVAFDLIWTQSYGSVGVDEICRRAGVHKGSFYYYFPSKADLAVEAYEENWRERQPLLDQVFSPQVPPLERLSRWCVYLRNRQEQKAKKYGHVCGCPYGSLGVELATQDEKIRKKVQEFVERNVRYVESALSDAKRAGLASIDDPHHMAVRVYSTALGMLLHCKIRNDLELLRDLEPTVMALIGAGRRGA